MKYLLIIIAILVILLATAGIVLFQYKQQLKPKISTSAQIINTPTPSNLTKAKPVASLALSSDKSVIRSNEQFDVSIDLSTSIDVYVVDFRLTYDPNAFRITAVKPGTFFKSPQEFKKTIKQADGTLLYSIGALQPASGKHSLAIVTFEAKTGIAKGSIMISDKTLVATKGAQAALLSLPKPLSMSIQ